MEAIVIVLLVVLIVIVGALAWDRLRKGGVDQRAEMTQMVNMTQQLLNTTQQTLAQRIDGLDQRLTQSLNSVQQTMTQSLTSTQETIGRVGQQLGRLETSSQQMLQVGQEIGKLQDVLKPPKIRGGFGELLLENLLTQILPPNDWLPAPLPQRGDCGRGDPSGQRAGAHRLEVPDGELQPAAGGGIGRGAKQPATGVPARRAGTRGRGREVYPAG